MTEEWPQLNFQVVPSAALKLVNLCTLQKGLLVVTFALWYLTVHTISDCRTGKEYLRNGGAGTSMPVMHNLQPRNLTTYRYEKNRVGLRGWLKSKRPFFAFSAGAFPISAAYPPQNLSHPASRLKTASCGRTPWYAMSARLVSYPGYPVDKDANTCMQKC